MLVINKDTIAKPVFRSLYII